MCHSTAGQIKREQLRFQNEKTTKIQRLGQGELRPSQLRRANGAHGSHVAASLVAIVERNSVGRARPNSRDVTVNSHAVLATARLLIVARAEVRVGVKIKAARTIDRVSRGRETAPAEALCPELHAEERVAPARLGALGQRQLADVCLHWGQGVRPAFGRVVAVLQAPVDGLRHER